MKSYNTFSMSHFRSLLNTAFDHVEEMRKEKATIERVEYVPMERPVDIMQEHQIMQALERLRVEKNYIMEWRRAGSREVKLDHNQAALLAETFQHFNMNFALTHDGGFQIG